jgi:hypothetical protein
MWQTNSPWLGRCAPACLLHSQHVTRLDGHRQIPHAHVGWAWQQQPLLHPNQLCPASQHTTNTHPAATSFQNCKALHQVTQHLAQTGKTDMKQKIAHPGFADALQPASFTPGTSPGWKGTGRSFTRMWGGPGIVMPHCISTPSSA